MCFERRRRKVLMIQRRVAFAKNSGTRGGNIDPQTHRPRLRGVISLLKISVCYKESLLETRVEESFLSGINFFITLISFRRTLRSILCACFLYHRRCIFSSPSSLSFCLLLLIPTLFPEAVAIYTRSPGNRSLSILHTSSVTKGLLAL